MQRLPTQPGNIRYQVGKSLNAIRNSIDMYDPIRLIHHLHLLYALAAPKVSLKEVKLPSAILLADDSATDHDARVVQAFQESMEALTLILKALSGVGIYAMTEPELEDASGLAVT